MRSNPNARNAIPSQSCYLKIQDNNSNDNNDNNNRCNNNNDNNNINIYIYIYIYVYNPCQGKSLRYSEKL